MYRNKTVYILGAGASWHYGYPTGDELVRRVIERSGRAAAIFDEMFNARHGPNPCLPKFVARNTCEDGRSTNKIKLAWGAAHDQCIALCRRLKDVHPTLIDYFLAKNEDLRDVGKFMIAWVLLECEATWMKENTNINRREMLERSPNRAEKEQAKTIDLQAYNDNWYRFILYQLVNGCNHSKDIGNNHVTFVTFNYDISLEFFLRRGLSAISLFEADDIDKFFQDGKIIHVYGKIRNNTTSGYSPLDFGIVSTGGGISASSQHNSGVYFPNLQRFFDTIYDASQTIKTIDPLEKTDNDAALKAARRAIAEAECVYILGYGFDESNSKRLEMDKHLRLERSGKHVLFTNYGDSNRVNKKASMLFFGRYDQFLSNQPPLKGELGGDYYCEKSVRNVYDALQFDFDSIEERLVVKD